MSGQGYKLVLLCAAFTVLVWGCDGKPAPVEKAYVLKSDTVLVTVDEFSEELDTKLMAYPYTIRKNPANYNEMVVDLVSVLVEETLLITAAQARGIQVSDAEVDKAEAEIKSDYPEDSFDQMMLENALSYHHWKERLKKKMIIERFVRRDLEQTVEITPDDVVDFYDRYRDEDGNIPEDSELKDEKKLLTRLRMEKSENAYGQWIKDLSDQYPIEMNQKAIAGFFIEDGKGKVDE